MIKSMLRQILNAADSTAASVGRIECRVQASLRGQDSILTMFDHRIRALPKEMRSKPSDMFLPCPRSSTLKAQKEPPSSVATWRGDGMESEFGSASPERRPPPITRGGHVTIWDDNEEEYEETTTSSSGYESDEEELSATSPEGSPVKDTKTRQCFYVEPENHYFEQCYIRTHLLAQ